MGLREFASCVACDSPSISNWKTKAFAYSGGGGERVWQIDRCADCRSGFLNPPPTVELLRSIYSKSGHGLRAPISASDVLEAERRWPNSSLDAERMVHGALRRTRGCDVTAGIDVGSGFGFTSNEMIRAGLDVTALNPGAYENTVFETINGFAPVPTMLEGYSAGSKRFGIAVMSQVLEHIVEPITALRTVRAMMDRGGVLACAVPNVASAAVRVLGTRDNACLWVPEHVNYFTSTGLRRVLERAGFDPLDGEQVTRVRPDALTRRLPAFLPEGPLRSIVQYGQIPVARILNRAGAGTFITVYARAS
jgi:hypothetical protein